MTAIAAPAIPEQGTQIGAYEVIREIGRGGMATILEARHGETGEVRAILARPWDLEDHPITVTATVTDERDRRFFDDLEAVVRWPAPVEGVPRELLCGPRS